MASPDTIYLFRMYLQILFIVELDSISIRVVCCFCTSHILIIVFFTVTDLNCPKGARYSLCGPGCKQTCRNFHFKRVCARQCVAGCQCPKGMVLHKDRCIPPTSCPIRKTPYRQRGHRKSNRNKHNKPVRVRYPKVLR